MSLADAVTAIADDMDSVEWPSHLGDAKELVRGFSKQLRLALKAAAGNPPVAARSDVDFHRSQIDKAREEFRKQSHAKGQASEVLDRIALIEGGAFSGDSIPVPPHQKDGDIVALGKQEYEYANGIYRYKGELG